MPQARQFAPQSAPVSSGNYAGNTLRLCRAAREREWTGAAVRRVARGRGTSVWGFGRAIDLGGTEHGTERCLRVIIARCRADSYHICHALLGYRAISGLGTKEGRARAASQCESTIEPDASLPITRISEGSTLGHPKPVILQVRARITAPTPSIVCATWSAVRCFALSSVSKEARKLVDHYFSRGKLCRSAAWSGC